MRFVYFDPRNAIGSSQTCPELIDEYFFKYNNHNSRFMGFINEDPRALRKDDLVFSFSPDGECLRLFGIIERDESLHYCLMQQWALPPYMGSLFRTDPSFGRLLRMVDKLPFFKQC